MDADCWAKCAAPGGNLRNGADALQGTPLQGPEIAQRARPILGEALESRFVGAGQNPGFVRHAWSVRAKRDEIAASLQDTQVLLHLLRNDVAENAALFLLEVFAAGAQFIKHAAWDKGGRGELRSGVLELLPCAGAVVLENADVLEAPVALEVLNALRGQLQKRLDLGIAGIPQLAVVPGILHQHFMGADRTHAIIETIAAAAGVAFHAVQAAWDAPWRGRTRTCFEFRAGWRSAAAGAAANRDRNGRRFRARSGVGHIVAGNHPGARNGIFTQFHAVRKPPRGRRVNCAYIVTRGAAARLL